MRFLEGIKRVKGSSVWGITFALKQQQHGKPKGAAWRRVNIKIVWGFVFMLIALSGQLTDNERV